MPLLSLSAENYRSLRKVSLRLAALTVVTGPNGSGKSNLYRILWLLARISEGAFARALAAEGGLTSAHWAGPRTQKGGVRMKIAIELDDFSFEFSCGFPTPTQTLFKTDPVVKEEFVWHGVKRKPSTLLCERSAGLTRIRGRDGEWSEYPLTLTDNESILSQLRDPGRFPELFTLREAIRDWRFYHHFRTDDQSPLRSSQIAVTTWQISHDGSDLAAALQTILAAGDADLLDEAIESAFPGRSLRIEASTSGGMQLLEVALATEGWLRPLAARELSDGTLKFLCLAAALLSPRPASLIALNEPEASLHPDLLRPLARLISDCSKRTQVWVTTHSRELVEALEELSGVRPVQLQLHNGETTILHPENG